MFRFILRRVIRGLVTLILFQTMLFGLVHAIPYDFSATLLVGPTYRTFIQHQFGLHLPFWQQYLRWLSGFIRLDLGVSYLHWPMTVSQILFGRISRTLLLFLGAAILAYLVGIWLGKMMASHRGGFFEVSATIGGVAAYTSFAPWLGFVLINLFGWYLGWLPYQRLVDHNVWLNASISIDALLGWMLISAIVAFGGLVLLNQLTKLQKSALKRWAWRGAGSLAIVIAVSFAWRKSTIGYLAVDVLRHLILPMGTVVLLSFGETMMLMRTSMLETQSEDYVLMARAKGLSRKDVRDRHVARTAVLPVITRLVLNLPFVLVGSLIIERVFMWDAMGKIIFDAIEYYDLPVLLGILSIVGVIAVGAHIFLDILYAYLDPRIRFAEAR
jgi:peptide/nickel transport system permease protein